MRVKFRNPPIDELVIGSYFPPVLQLEAQHVGSFWASVLDTFPRCSQQGPLGEWVQAQDEPTPMPRFWLITEDDSRLIQIQKNAFIANWRNRPNVAYPHYADVKHFFEEYLAKFKTFLMRTTGAEIREVLNLELMYTNFLIMDGLKVFSDLVRLVPGIGAPRLPEGVNNIVGYSGSYNIDVAADLGLRITVIQAKRNIDGADGLALQIRAGGIPDPRDWLAASVWFDKAHDQIGKVFLSVTTEELQNSWGPLIGGSI